MPAICVNVQDWHNTPSKSGWHTSSPYAGWFTYDIGASRNTLDRGTARRDEQCPRSWKGTIANPKCPEQARPANPAQGIPARQAQPRVVPPWYDLQGNGVVAIKPQPPTDPDVHLIIEDGRSDPRFGQLGPSGRIYSCDEFPPASWIEGGVGITGTNDARAGTTYCAPISYSCAGSSGTGSEQNWQGSIHGFLGAHLEAKLASDGYVIGQDFDWNSAVAFRFVYESHEAEGWAARIVTDDLAAGIFQQVSPNTPFTRRDGASSKRSVIEFHPNGNGSLAIQLQNGEVFHTHERGGERRARLRARQLALEGNSKDDSSVNNKTEISTWFVASATSFHKLANIAFQAHHR